VLKEPVALLLAPLAVAFLVGLVPVLAVVFDPFTRELAGDDAEVIHPPF
jgi:hypothetical protein